MEIGEIIKKLRRERGLTQEELAEALGVSSSAVSQWECGRILPDITQIPLLAGIFDVSADVLLGVDTLRQEKRLKEILALAGEQSRSGRHAEAAAILRDGRKRLPQSAELKLELAEALVNAVSRKQLSDSYDEAIALCRSVMKESTDTVLRQRAHRLLICAYDYAGMEQECRAALDELPAFAYCRETAMVYRWQGDEGIAGLRFYLGELFCETLTVLEQLAMSRHDDGKPAYTKEEQETILAMIPALLAMFYPDGDAQGDAQLAINACHILAERCRKRGDDGGFFGWMERLADCAAEASRPDNGKRHTALLFRESGGCLLIPENGENKAAEIARNIENDPDLEPYRGDPRFLRLLERLQEAAERR